MENLLNSTLKNETISKNILNYSNISQFNRDFNEFSLNNCIKCEKLDRNNFLVKRNENSDKTIINLKNNISIGGKKLSIIAGPCSIESIDQMIEAALAVKEHGATILRGGAYKPRSSPYSFQGAGELGLKILKKAGEKVNLPIITEVIDPEDINIVAEYVDVLQVGARNAQNFSLLKKLGKINKPVLLKRGMMNTIEELLCSAEYILSGGNNNVILCERGIRTFERETRFTLDISAVPILKEKTHLPIIVDPSHAAGNWRLIESLSFAAVAAGADGLMIEVHPDPKKALCDGDQSLKPSRFKKIVEKLKELAKIMGREI
jgi:3-deoxy-7-phosphoheptulonate synthase